MSESKNIYLHPGQQYILAHPAKTKVGVCGRGYGKSSVIGLESYNCIANLPRSRGFFLGLTYNQILTKFLPPILDVWGRIGLKEHLSPSEPGHYVIGVKPPDYWTRPYATVKKYTNVISFFNGAYIELLSMDRKDLNLGGSFDWGNVDEIQGINKDRFYKEYFIAIRGNIFRYENNPFHHRLVMMGTMPWMASGQWILDFQQRALEDPSILYLERKSYDNIKALGKDYFKKLKAELPAMIYDVEIENRRVNILTDGFYPEFNDQRHCYFNAYRYSEEMPSISSLSAFTPEAADYDKTKPLEISFDFGASVTTIIIAQEEKNIIRIIDMMYETSSGVAMPDDDAPKNPLQKAMTNFIKKYGRHENVINIYGDHTGHNRSDRSETSYQVVEGMLRKAKLFFINKVEKTTNPSHTKKYHVINDILAEKSEHYPKVRINQNTCKGLIISIQISPVNDDYTKDKRSERDTSLAPEKQTHFSDAFDYLVYGKSKHLFGMDYGLGNYMSISVGTL